MIRTYGCISIIVKRDSVKNQKLLERWIEERNKNEEGTYDEHLVCFAGGMNPRDAADSVEALNERLGIEIYDKTNPYEPVAKDGVVVEDLFGVCAPCNWLKKERHDGRVYWSFIPEEERRPQYIPEKYDPAMDEVIGEFGEYKGYPIVLKENAYEIYLLHGEERYHVPFSEEGPLERKICSAISLEDTILCIDDWEAFHNVINKRIVEEADAVKRIKKQVSTVVDFGDTPEGNLRICKGKYVNYIRLEKKKESKNFKLPKEYWKDDELCKTLDKKTVLAIIRKN